MRASLPVAAWLIGVVAGVASSTAAQDGPEPRADETVIPVASGPPITLPGCWTVRTSMWEDAALVYYDRYAWWSLDAGARSPRRVHKYPRLSGAAGSGPSWSRDGEALFIWLELERQLTRVQIATGAMESLTSLSAHVWNYEGWRHMDPEPVARRAGCVEDPATGLLLQLLQEEDNHDVAFWQRSQARQGGHTLVGFDPQSGEMISLFGGGQLPGKAVHWDLSLSRNRLFVLDVPLTIVERELNGRLVRQFPFTAGIPSDILLSPDESTLLVERLYKPGVAAPQGELGGGFVLIDLDHLVVRAGPDEGHCCAWSPDGVSIAYLGPWELRIYDIRLRSAEMVARRQSSTGRTHPSYYEGPAWSADGRRLAVGIGGDEQGQPTLLLDLVAREALVLGLHAQDVTWSSEPHPFPQGFKDPSGS